MARSRVHAFFTAAAALAFWLPASGNEVNTSKAPAATTCSNIGSGCNADGTSPCPKGVATDCSGRGTCPDGNSCGGSAIDPVGMMYMHFGYDYYVDLPGGGGTKACSSCGEVGAAHDGPGTIGRLPALNITRVLKPRLTFGLGNSQGFGLNSVLADSVVARVQPEPTAGVGPTIRFFDPLGSSQQFVVLDSDAGGVGDGLFGQLDSSVLRVVAYDADFTVVGELFTAAGTPTSDATAMRSLEVIFRDGRRWCFEVIRTEADSTTEPLRSARILRREDASGQGVTLRYDVTVADAYAAEAADPAGYNLDRLWHLASVTGPYGNVASFTYTASPLLQAWPIERIDLPDGNAVTYAYDATGRLTGVAHPDGSQSVFTYFQPADPNLHGIGIFDPAADPTHRRKELFLTKASWSDGTSAPVPVPADRVVRMNNGAGELAFASWERVISGIRSNIYTYWGGNRYDRIEQSRGIILGKSFASVPVFAADGSLDENATTWEPLEAYDGHQYRMARERTDALGRVTDFSIDFTRRITGRTDHADGSSSFTLFESTTAPASSTG